MDKNDAMRRTLIDSAAYILANEGYYRATTKNIAAHASLNEAYIYRFFESKEDLIRCAFALDDNNLAALLMKSIPLMRMQELPFEDRCRALFMRAYELMISNHDHAIFYVRYYYSEQYRQYAIADHRACYCRVVEELKSFFKPGENSAVMLRFVFESTINIVFRVAGGDIENTPQVADQLFKLVYRAIEPGFKDGLAG